MLEHQIVKLANIIKDENMKRYAGDAFYNLIKAVIFHDVETSTDVVKDVKEILFHMPTVLFWDKMKRYIYGTFKSYDDQVKFAAKFEKDNTLYFDFVKKQISIINSIDEDEKIDFFSQLTRCFLLCEIDRVLYFKLVYLLKNCTVDELEYLKKREMSEKSENNMWVSVLSLQGIFVQQQDDNGNVVYVLSDIGKYLKMCSLNFDDGSKSISKKYEALNALPSTQRAKVIGTTLAWQ